MMNESRGGVRGTGKVKGWSQGTRMLESRDPEKSRGLGCLGVKGSGRVKGRVDRCRVDWSEENLQLVITFDRLNQKVSLRGQNWVAHST